MENYCRVYSKIYGRIKQETRTFIYNNKTNYVKTYKNITKQGCSGFTALKFQNLFTNMILLISRNFSINWLCPLKIFKYKNVMKLQKEVLHVPVP